MAETTLKPLWYRGSIALLPSVLVDEDAVVKAKERGFSVETFSNQRGSTTVLSTASPDLEVLKKDMLELMAEVNWATYTVDACVINSLFENKWNVPRLPVVKGGAQQE